MMTGVKTPGIAIEARIACGSAPSFSTTRSAFSRSVATAR